jgi:predicted HicB family RNase H-like nuclease
MKRKFSISLDRSLHERLTDVAKKDGRSLSNFIEQLAHHHLRVQAVVAADSRPERRRREAAR